MCRRRPELPSPMGDSSNGMNVSFIQHADVAFSAGAFVLFLLVIGAFCACRRGMCLQWILGPRFMQLATNPTSQTCPSTSITMPTIQSASAPTQPSDPVEQEIAALQKSNQLFELQQRRSQLLAQANLGHQGARRALPGSCKYPVMGTQKSNRPSTMPIGPISI